MGWRFIRETILTECMLSVVWLDSCNLKFKPWLHCVLQCYCQLTSKEIHDDSVVQIEQKVDGGGVMHCAAPKGFHKKSMHCLVTDACYKVCLE